MIPSSPSADSFKGRSQKLPHPRYPVRDANQLVEPLLSQIGLVQDHGSDSGSVSWRRRIVGSDDDLDLGEHFSGGLAILANHMHRTGSFSVESHDLGEGLGNDHLEALVDEIPEGLPVFVEVASDETLVRGIEEWIQTVFLADLGDLLPLIHGGVDTCGVVRARVQKDAGSGGRVLQIVDHSLEIKAKCLLVEVSVFAHIHSNSSE